MSVIKRKARITGGKHIYSKRTIHICFGHNTS